jgi:hypothetical protein
MEPGMNPRTRDDAILFGGIAVFIAVFFAINVFLGIPFMEPGRPGAANPGGHAFYLAK